MERKIRAFWAACQVWAGRKVFGFGGGGVKVKDKDKDKGHRFGITVGICQGIRVR